MATASPQKMFKFFGFQDGLKFWKNPIIEPNDHAFLDGYDTPVQKGVVVFGGVYGRDTLRPADINVGFAGLPSFAPVADNVGKVLNYKWAAGYPQEFSAIKFPTGWISLPSYFLRAGAFNDQGSCFASSAWSAYAVGPMISPITINKIAFLPSYHMRFEITGPSIGNMFNNVVSSGWYNATFEYFYGPRWNPGSYVASFGASNAGMGGSLPLLDFAVDSNYRTTHVSDYVKVAEKTYVTVYGKNVVQSRFSSGWIDTNIATLPVDGEHYVSRMSLNDRTDIVIGNTGMHLQQFQASLNGLYYGVSNAIITLLNGASYAAYTGATLFVSGIQEYAGRLNYVGPTFGHSLSSGYTAEAYPRSIYPSEGMQPYVVDWNKEILIDTVNPLVAVCEFKGKNFVFTASEIFYYSYDSNGDVQIVKLTDAYGVNSKNAMVAIDQGLFFANVQGAFVTDGVSITKLSDIDVWSYFFIANQAAKSVFTATFNSRTNQVWFSERNIQRTLIYDLDKKIWMSVSFVARMHDHIESEYPYNTPKDLVFIDEGGQFVYNNEPFNAQGGTIADTGHTYNMALTKRIVLSPNYAQKAQAVYAYIGLKELSAGIGVVPQQYIKFSSYWEGDTNNNPTTQVLAVSPVTHIAYPGHYMIKVPVNGTGNILDIQLYRNFASHGFYPLEVAGIMMEYSVT